MAAGPSVILKWLNTCCSPEVVTKFHQSLSLNENRLTRDGRQRKSAHRRPARKNSSTTSSQSISTRCLPNQRGEVPADSRLKSGLKRC